MTALSSLSLALRLALRDLRGGLGGMWLLFAGVLVGVSAVALINVASDRLLDGARRGALQSVGGDLSLRLFHRPPRADERAAVHALGDVTESTEVRPMVRAVRGGGAAGPAVLAELKGVDGNYPLFGRVTLSGGVNLQSVLAFREGHHGAVADSALFSALGVRPGDRVRIGANIYKLRAELISEPDRAFRAFMLGPRILVANGSLPASGLVNEGSEAYFYTRVRLPAGAAAGRRAAAALREIERAFPDAGWRLVNAREGAPGIERALAIGHALLLFIGVGVFLVGGSGVAAAVTAHVRDRTRTLAILKSVGASPRLITMLASVQVLSVAALASLTGCILGSAAALALLTLFQADLPFALDLRPGAVPVAGAFLFGILISAVFTLWPLAAVRGIGARNLLHGARFRDTPNRSRPWLPGAVLSAALLVLLVFTSPLPWITGAMLGGALVLCLLFHLLGGALAWVARRAAMGKGANLRLALGGLHRAGAPTGPVVMASGLTLTLLVALSALGHTASRHVSATLPAGSPDLVAFSMPAPVAARLDRGLKEGRLITSVRSAPFLHARLQAVGGVPVGDLQIPPALRWVVRGDRGVSALPDAGFSGFSVERSVAGGMGLGLGERITLNISGHKRTAAIRAFHDVDWTALDLDFPILMSPDLLAGIPHTYAAALKAGPGMAGELERYLRQTHPDVPLIRIGDVLASLSAALGAIADGLGLAALMCALAALVVLGGNVLQGLRPRMREFLLFRVLGASRWRLRWLLMTEFLLLGSVCVITAVPLGLLAASGVARAAGLGGLNIWWTDIILLSVLTVGATLAVGLGVTRRACHVVPARKLRKRRDN